MEFTKVSLIIKPQKKIPYFIGSQLRGALGYALKKVTCINPSFKCEGCFSASNCVYYQFYEKKNSFHKYRFDFILGLKYYDFNLYLFGDATKQLPYIVSALHMMLTKNGLGRERTLYPNFELFINDEQALKNQEIQLPKNYIKKLQIDDVNQHSVLHIKTPLRIKKENNFIRDDRLELKDIINSIYQRQMQLLDRKYKKFPYSIEGRIVQKELQYKELTRMSNRQKTTMNLGGIMGKVEITGLNKECYEVLKVGELIGVGKQTVFGLGKIEVKEA
jgi:CRISPR-associated endoribonuclease Cas6